jgi:hypothetical protein
MAFDARTHAPGRRSALAALLVTAVLVVGCSQPTPQPPAADGPPRSRLAPVGARILSDDEAAARVRRVAERRPGNRTANTTVPTTEALARYRRSYVADTGSARFRELRNRVTGGFTGTTDEIIQWTAVKWGLPEDLVRAQAFDESTWHMDRVGDGGRSFGIMQIKDEAMPGTAPLSRESTAFNLDHYGFVIRAYYEAVHPWLRDAEAGDLWGAVGAWFSGAWHDADARAYVGRVQSILRERPWERPGF